MVTRELSKLFNNKIIDIGELREREDFKKVQISDTCQKSRGGRLKPYFKSVLIKFNGYSETFCIRIWLWGPISDIFEEKPKYLKSVYG